MHHYNTSGPLNYLPNFGGGSENNLHFQSKPSIYQENPYMANIDPDETAELGSQAIQMTSQPRTHRQLKRRELTTRSQNNK